MPGFSSQDFSAQADALRSVVEPFAAALARAADGMVAGGEVAREHTGRQRRPPAPPAQPEPSPRTPITSSARMVSTIVVRSLSSASRTLPACSAAPRAASRPVPAGTWMGRFQSSGSSPAAFSFVSMTGRVGAAGRVGECARCCRLVIFPVFGPLGRSAHHPALNELDHRSAAIPANTFCFVTFGPAVDTCSATAAGRRPSLAGSQRP